ncbi:MAG: YibE/F family protein [bacterium]
MKYILCAVVFVLVSATFCMPVQAINTSFYRGVVQSLQPQEKTMSVRLTLKAEQTSDVVIPTFQDQTVGIGYQVGDKLIISRQDVEGKALYAVSERDRSMAYGVLIALFVAVVILIGRFQGLISIGAMVLSFGLLTQFTIPQIVEGVDPIVISMLTALVIIPLTFFFSHGFRKKTLLAVIATLIALLITGVLAVGFTKAAVLTGMSSDEADAVMFKFGSHLHLSDLLIAGMIISAMGVLDDVTIAQVGIVQALNKVRPDMKNHHLFAEAMEQGRDHIASLVNTLILVYAGAALPLFLLVYRTETPLWVVIQREAIAEEITRTFVSSIGIIAAVPIATLIAVKWGKRQVGHLQKEKLF